MVRMLKLKLGSHEDLIDNNYRNYGAIRGSDINTTTLFQVKPGDVGELLQKCWVEQVDLVE